MKNWGLFLCIFLISSLAFGSDSGKLILKSDTANLIIKGKLRDAETGERIISMPVILLDSSEEVLEGQLTDEKGSFQFDIEKQKVRGAKIKIQFYAVADPEIKLNEKSIRTQKDDVQVLDLSTVFVQMRDVGGVDPILYFSRFERTLMAINRPLKWLRPNIQERYFRFAQARKKERLHSLRSSLNDIK